MADVADWALEEKQSDKNELSYEISNAIGALTTAEDIYETAKEPEADDTLRGDERQFNLAKSYMKRGCQDVKRYPVDIGRDGNWKDFTRRAGSLLRYFEDDRLSTDKVSKQVRKTKNNVRSMEEDAEEEDLDWYL